MIFHIDANSFYASCEQLFRPDLAHTGIVVLSNNDGIIIALNEKAKQLGFSRGDAWHKVGPTCKAKGIHVFSSNYTLYADISSRLVSIYNRLCPDVEVYSIDECFLYYPNWNCPKYEDLAQHIRSTVLKEVGIPISIGIAPSKTLAKISNKIAKKTGGIFMWNDAQYKEKLQTIPIEQVWGIGSAKAKTLKRLEIKNALELRNLPLHIAKKHLTITGFRTVQELNGIASNESLVAKKNKSICSSKSFKDTVSDLTDLEEALSAYTMEAVSRLRAQNSAANFVSVYIMTNSRDATNPQYFNHLCVPLNKPTSFLPEILSTAKTLLRSMYKSGFLYKKVMITLLGLQDDIITQKDLFVSARDFYKKQNLMHCFDAINARYGRNTLKIGLGKNNNKKWHMQRNYLSPAYTTDANNFPFVR